MSEQKETLLQQQKANRPKIEEAINEYIEDENAKKITLDFIAWLRKNKMSPSWSARNYWKVSCYWKDSCNKSKLFLIRVNKNVVIIERFYRDFTGDYQTFIINNNLQNLVCNNMTVCRRFESKSCTGCPPSPDFTGISINICGKEIKNICRGVIMKFVNPDYETIEGIKKLVEYNII